MMTFYLFRLADFMALLQTVYGNICIAGHNYDNGQLFSNTKALSIGDSIYLTDLSGSTVKYTIYDIFEIDSSNVNCTSQETNGRKEVTLVTCNNLNGNRIIIKAK